MLQVHEAGVDGAAQLAVAGKVHIHAGRVGVDGVELVVGQHTVIAAQAFTEGHIAGRGQADHLDALALRQLEGGAVGGLARRAGQQHDAGAEEIVVGQEVVDQPRGDEQGAQQRLHVLGVWRVERVGRAARELVVDRVQLGTVRRTIKPALRRHAHRRQHHAGGHGEIAVDAFADRHPGMGGLDHRGKAPDRDAAPGVLARGVETPVVHGVTKGGVGDVVGRSARNGRCARGPGRRPVARRADRASAFGPGVLADVKGGGVHGATLPKTRRDGNPARARK